ncbi:MAG TPA: hypothetical protein VMF91_12490 [Bryobacteraceae bacterium]|nr:hypothetical protein [Bryobacteraceae bacterium]
MRSHGVVEILSGHREKFYPLPQSTSQDYIRLRPADVRLNPFNPRSYERQEVIGPSQVEEGKIWFGKAFYDAEGCRGVGAFGYFDTITRSFTLFSPPEVAPYEVSAILVQRDTVWLGLDHFGEDISTYPGGLVRWDKNTHEARRYPIEFVVSGIEAQGDSLRLQTKGGYALLRDNKLQRFLKNGREIDGFPPPPTQY